MPFLIGCQFEGNSRGWRVRKCLSAPWPFIIKRVAHRDGMLWVVADDIIKAGRFINPADNIIRSKSS